MAIRAASRFALICVLGAAIGVVACRRTSSTAPTTLATTTSVENSGLLERILPAYRQQTEVVVRVFAVGSGRALKMIDATQADVAITHAPAEEAKFVTAHPTWYYRKILFNRFLIVGPGSDPANARGAPTAAEAMRRIAISGARFISRGDESGTHERERQLWTAAHETPARERLVIAGAGMGQTLRIASETESYTLTDEATFGQLARHLNLRILSAGDPVLLNTYAVTADPSNSPGRRFADWIAEGLGRKAVEELLAAGQLRGFTVWPTQAPRGAPSDLPVAQPPGVVPRR
jgi:tungstate transport system substrate-binding protein